MSGTLLQERGQRAHGRRAERADFNAAIDLVGGWRIRFVSVDGRPALETVLTVFAPVGLASISIMRTPDRAGVCEFDLVTRPAVQRRVRAALTAVGGVEPRLERISEGCAALAG